MNQTEHFIKSFVNAFPKIQTLANQITSKHKLFVNYPLTLKNTSSNRFAIQSEGPISKGNDIFLLAMSECMFSSGFTGTSPKDQLQITQQMAHISSQYDSMNKDFMERTKIYLQILAHKQELTKGQMSLKNYAQYILNSPQKGLVKANINSRFLMDLYQSWQMSTKITYQYLKKQLIKRVEEQDYINASNKGRLVIRSAGNSPYLFAAPFLDKLDHSFDPNCEFQMLYLPHRRQPYVRIRTIRNINTGQRPTINYGLLNNYELLIRYGFSVRNNPNSVFMLPLNFQNIIQIFNKNIEWKQAQFLKHNLKLKNYVKILPSGKLNDEDSKMLKILICDSQNPTENVLNSTSYDKLINHFISDHATNMRKNIKINSLKVSSDKNIQILQEEQIAILDHFLKINS